MADPAKLAFAVPAFDAFKNNDYKTGSLAVSGTIGASSSASYSGSATLSRSDSVTQIYFSTSVASDYHATSKNYLFTSDTLIHHSNGSATGFPGSATYDIQFSVGYSSNTLTLTANILNQFPSTLTVVSETISFEVYTSVAPFDN